MLGLPLGPVLGKVTSPAFPTSGRHTNKPRVIAVCHLELQVITVCHLELCLRELRSSLQSAQAIASLGQNLLGQAPLSQMSIKTAHRSMCTWMKERQPEKFRPPLTFTSLRPESTAFYHSGRDMASFSVSEGKGREQIVMD